MNRKSRNTRSFGPWIWAAAGFALCLVMVGLVFAAWDALSARDASVLDRLDVLERQMARKTRPELHIERATVYNARGEIAIRTFDEDKSSID